MAARSLKGGCTCTVTQWKGKAVPALADALI